MWALHVQWVGRFVRRFSAWMQFLFYYARVLYGSTPGDLLSYPRRVDLSSLPPFYQAVLSSWVTVDGGFFAPADTFIVASSSVRARLGSLNQVHLLSPFGVSPSRASLCSKLWSCVRPSLLALHLGSAVLF